MWVMVKKVGGLWKMYYGGGVYENREFVKIVLFIELFLF